MNPIKKAAHTLTQRDGFPLSFNLRCNKYARKPKSAIECIECPLGKLSELTWTRCSNSGRGLSKMDFSRRLSSRTPIKLKTNKSTVLYLLSNKNTHIKNPITGNKTYTEPI